MVTADAVVINCPQGCVLQMAALPQSPECRMVSWKFVWFCL